MCSAECSCCTVGQLYHIVPDLKARYSECEKAFMGKNVDEYCTFLHADVEMWAPHGPPVVGKEGMCISPAT